MITPPNATKHIHRGYARAYPRRSVPVQIEALVAAGCPRGAIYTDEKGGMEAFAKSLRSGELGGMDGGLRVIGDTRKIMTEGVAMVHAKAAAIVDIGTGQRSDRDGVQMLDAALARIHGERKIGNRASEMGKKGAKNRWKRQHNARMPTNQARVLWFDKGISTAEALEDMTGWTKASAFREFGPSGRKAGRFDPENRVRYRTPLPAAEPDAPKPRKPRGKQGFVYFMRINGRGPVKIGFAVNVSNRLKSHKAANHGTLVIVAAMRGTLKSEKQLHARFAKLRVKGTKEWFKFSGDLKTFVEALPRIDTEE